VDNLEFTIGKIKYAFGLIPSLTADEARKMILSSNPTAKFEEVKPTKSGKEPSEKEVEEKQPSNKNQPNKKV